MQDRAVIAPHPNAVYWLPPPQCCPPASPTTTTHHHLPMASDAIHTLTFPMHSVFWHHSLLFWLWLLSLMTLVMFTIPKALRAPESSSISLQRMANSSLSSLFLSTICHYFLSTDVIVYSSPIHLNVYRKAANTDTPPHQHPQPQPLHRW